MATLDMPSLPNSDTPGLLGLAALQKFQAVIDTKHNRVYVNTNHVEFDLLHLLPSGYREIQCELAPTGHMMAPCCEFGSQAATDDTMAFALMTSQPAKAPSDPPTDAPILNHDASVSAIPPAPERAPKVEKHSPER